MPARLAPTPSGYLHRGNAANFLLNARLAEADGRLFLRIDDLDRARFREEYLEDIFRVIERLGIEVTDGPKDAEDFQANWSQEIRTPAYQAALEQLRDHPLLFACPCSRKELATGKHHHGCLRGEVTLDMPGVAWRVNTRSLAAVTIPDVVRAEDFTITPHDAMPDFALRRKDERPAYQLACVVDDELFGIDVVGRGQDLLPSTAAQSLVSDMLGYESLFERIRFLHHPLITEAGGAKLSKSAGAAGVSGLASFDVEELHGLVESWLTKG